jgi:hypothetical protein
MAWAVNGNFVYQIEINEINERKQGFPGDPFYERVRCWPMLGSFKPLRIERTLQKSQFARVHLNYTKENFAGTFRGRVRCPAMAGSH